MENDKKVREQMNKRKVNKSGNKGKVDRQTREELR